MISIVTAYYNRKSQFKKTLKSISLSAYKDFEVIAVDDASNEKNRIEDLSEQFSFLKIIRIEKKNKYWVNPCVPFNMGFKKAKGEIVILQNPENLHLHDILSYVAKYQSKKEYLVFGCYSLTEKISKSLSLVSARNYSDVLEGVLPLNNISIEYAKDGEEGCWYNHSVFRPVGYHFCSSIFKNKLDSLKGFDERYAYGIGYDDDDFVSRVKKMIDFRFVDDFFVGHQYHGRKHNLDNLHLEKANKDLYGKDVYYFSKKKRILKIFIMILSCFIPFKSWRKKIRNSRFFCFFRKLL